MRNYRRFKKTESMLKFFDKVFEDETLIKELESAYIRIEVTSYIKTEYFILTNTNGCVLNISTHLKNIKDIKIILQYFYNKGFCININSLFEREFRYRKKIVVRTIKLLQNFDLKPYSISSSIENKDICFDKLKDDNLYWKETTMWKEVNIQILDFDKFVIKDKKIAKKFIEEYYDKENFEELSKKLFKKTFSKSEILKILVS